MGAAEREDGLSSLVVLVGKETAVGENITRCMFRLSVIRTSEEDVVVREPPCIGGSISSAI